MQERQPNIGQRTGEIVRDLGLVAAPVGFFVSTEIFTIGVIAIFLGMGIKKLSSKNNIET